jgi:hypothetical protein
VGRFVALGDVPQGRRNSPTSWVSISMNRGTRSTRSIARCCSRGTSSSAA